MRKKNTIKFYEEFHEKLLREEKQETRFQFLLDFCADELAKAPDEEFCSKEENEVYGNIANLVNSLQILLSGE